MRNKQNETPSPPESAYKTKNTMTAKNPFQIKFEQIELSKIEISANNPRKNIDQEALSELAQSIKTHGVLQPIVVLQNQAPGQQKPYTVLCGERRYRAAKIAGLAEIPAIIRRDIDNTIDQTEMALAENLQREDLSPLEEMAVFNTIISDYTSTIDEIAQRFGKSTAYIKGRLMLQKLSGDFQKLLQESFISLTIAQELCRYSNEVQGAVYDNHYAADSQQSWIGRGNREVVLNLKHGYSKDLRDYHFDKSSCMECGYNSKNCTLFAEDKLGGSCLNIHCLNYKNTCFVVEKAARLVEQHPELPLVLISISLRMDAKFKELSSTTRSATIGTKTWSRNHRTLAISVDAMVPGISKKI